MAALSWNLKEFFFKASIFLDKSKTEIELDIMKEINNT